MVEKAILRKALIFLCRLFFILFLGYLAYAHFWHILSANLLVAILFVLPYFTKQKYVLKFPFELEFIFLLFLVFSSLVGQFLPEFAQLLFGLTLGFLGFVFIFTFLFNRDSKFSFRMVFFLSLCVSVAMASFLEITKFYLKSIFGFSISYGDHQFAMANLLLVVIGSIISNILGYLYLTQLKGRLFKGVARKIREENPNLFISRSKAVDEVGRVLISGEGERVEFKSSLRVNLHTGQADSRVEHAVLKSISSFLNSEGGFLFIGVSDKSEILGLDKDGFENLDLFNRHLTNLIKEDIGPEFLPFLGFDFFKFDDNKTILRISCMKSSKPVFLKFEGREDFFIRIGASTILLSGNRMIDYIKNKFNR